MRSGHALLLVVLCPAIANAQTNVYPASDPANRGEWHLNESVSDEFEDAKLDTSKWHIQGTDGKYYSNFIGRAPSQFSTENVRVEDGKLKLVAKWEPGFGFSKKIDLTDSRQPEGRRYENITTAAVIGKKTFLYGYMEIKCKAADASVTSTFWMTGNKAELDVFEHLGKPKQPDKAHLETEMWSSIHDWSRPPPNSTWTKRRQLPFRVADDFHVYGVEWDEAYLNFFVDGKLLDRVTRTQVETNEPQGWAIDGPLRLWVDSETFPWHGVPTEADLPVDYEIEYIRVWHKNHADQLLFGFEGPATIAGKSMDWWIAKDSQHNFSIDFQRASSGDRSLKFTHSGKLAGKVTAFAPGGSMRLEPGKYDFSMKIWLEPQCSVKRLRVILQEPWRELKPFDLSELDKGKWVTLTQSFLRNAPSGANDRPRIVIQPDDVPGSSGTLFIDDISFEKSS